MTQPVSQNSVAFKAFCVLLTSPRCYVCGQILEGSVTFAIDRYWCRNHFTCARCNINLRLDQYIPFDEKAYCPTCYNISRPFCRRCGNALLHGQKYLALEKFYWHDSCFKCSACGQMAGQDNYFWKDDKLYCLKCASTGLK